MIAEKGSKVWKQRVFLKPLTLERMMTMKKFFLILLLSAGLTTAVPAAESYTNAYDAIALFTTVLEEVHRSFVDSDEAGYDQLIHHALTGMLQDLDPYSQFLDETSYKDLRDDTSGHFSGVGLVISVKDRMLTVVSPMEDSPAFREGIISGDVIIEINGEETRSMTLSDAVKKMRGESGTEVKLKIVRPSTHKTQDYAITREEIKVASVKGAKILENGIGYLRITQFNEPTAENVKGQLKQLLDENMKALVLDLRGNPGGLLTSAAGVAELFLPRGDLIVFTKGRTKEMGQQQFKSSGDTHYTDFPMAILVDDGSASASEIVSGALQDQKRAILIGEKTFGKGCVQSILPLGDGSAVKLTTAKYYTPSERVIDGHGIEPDIQVEMDPEVLYKIRIQQSLHDAPPGGLPESGSKLQDVQLEKAVGVLQGVLIFQDLVSQDKK
jgi:carboxyl-terminal processing protease